MRYDLIITFLVLSSVFAATHYFALLTFLYWRLSWFDLVMHFWGGILIALGLHALTTFNWLPLKPTLKVLLITLAFCTIAWEIFEYWADLYQPETYGLDTVQDILIAFIGGLLAHTVLKKYTIGK